MAATEDEVQEINIVLADDHEVVRAGLRLLLQGEETMHVVGEAGDVPGALRLVDSRCPDVLVLDLNMPGPPSLSVIAEVKDKCAVVVLTMQSDPAFAREALQAGARAYVLKEAAGAELLTAVRMAAAGGTYLNPQLGARIAAEPAAATEAADHLSPREVEVLRLIALGHTNAEIGEQLFLSVRTVETHRSHIQRKLSLTTRADLVGYALEHGLLET
jgi:two-component system response regulator NreC